MFGGGSLGGGGFGASGGGGGGGWICGGLISGGGLAIAISSGSWTFGWYLMPIYPFLCLGAGRYLADLWREPDLARGTLLVALPLMYSMNLVFPVDYMKAPENWGIIRTEVTVFLVGLVAPFALAQAFRIGTTRALARATTALAIALLAGLGIHFVVRYDVLSESHENFDRLVYFDR